MKKKNAMIVPMMLVIRPAIALPEPDFLPMAEKGMPTIDSTRAKILKKGNQLRDKPTIPKIMPSVARTLEDFWGAAAG